MSRSSTATASFKVKPVREPRHLLILGGTGQARALAESATAQFAPSLRVTTSLAGRTLSPARLAGEVRRGGFGGAAGLADYLRATQIDFVIDATHPFAARISSTAQEACAALGIPLLTLARAAWVKEAGDHWIEAADAAEAAAQLPGLGRRAFLTIGHRDIAAFAGVGGVHFLVRLVDPPAGPLPLQAYDLVIGRGPFTIADERLIMEQHAIDVLVSKASGGASTAAKLAAARALRIPVIMLRRPPQEARASVDRVEDALAWIERRLLQSQEALS
jgi:precorrin-6A/cobalt-precorrin-6A reductase